MMGMKPIHSKRFSKYFMYTIYQKFNDKCYIEGHSTNVVCVAVHRVQSSCTI